MGQEESRHIDPNAPPKTLQRRDIASVAKHIRDGRAKRVVVMVEFSEYPHSTHLQPTPCSLLTYSKTGAGISTSAGIPDFRSPDTGLYANLARLDLPYAEAVFDISYFRQNPAPFYSLAHELYPGKYRPTVAHLFVRLLHDKGHLLKLFTQNIDCLERDAGVPAEKIVEAHGSFATHSCVECKTAYPDARMREAVAAKEIPRCMAPGCGGLVKPDIVFFGEQLPKAFLLNRTLPAAADLCLVMGTSLSVQPFASLPGFCAEGVPRVLINRERVGGLGSRPDDVLILEDCDAGVRRLAAELGWANELERLWRETHPDEVRPETEGVPKTKDELLEAEVEKLASDVDSALKFSDDHEKRVRDQLADKVKAEVEGGARDATITPTAALVGKTGDDAAVARDLPAEADESIEHNTIAASEHKPEDEKKGNQKEGHPIKTETSREGDASQNGKPVVEDDKKDAAPNI